MSHQAATSFNELDPHGAELPGHGQHHSHPIVGPFTLRSILALLLVFTVLTVGQAQAELWLTGAFDIAFPLWVNIVVVMGIATVKALLVMAFFMQLRYDNPLNTIIMAFCFFAMSLFLGFTAMDLLTRGRVTEFKNGPVVAGGTGAGVPSANGQPLIIAARLRYMEKFLSEPALVEARLTARLLDTATQGLSAAAPAGHVAHASSHDVHADDLTDSRPGERAAPEVLAAEAVNAVATEIRHKVAYRQSLPSPRLFASASLNDKAANLIANAHPAAAALVTAVAQAVANGPLPADTKELAAHDFDLLALEAHAHSSHGHHDDHAHATSDKNATRGKTGLSGALHTTGDAHSDSDAHEVHPPEAPTNH